MRSENECNIYHRSNRSEVLFSPHESKVRTRVHIALGVKRAFQRLGAAKEDSRFCRSVDLADTSEDGIPIGPTKVGGRT